MTRAAVATSMVIVLIVFPHYLIWHFNRAASRDALVLLAPRRGARSPGQVVPRRIVPASQKYSHIRVSSSEAVTAAHAKTKARGFSSARRELGQVTTFTLRYLRGVFVVTGLEPLVFKSRREAKDWCAEHHLGSPIREVGHGRLRRKTVAVGRQEPPPRACQKKPEKSPAFLLDAAMFHLPQKIK